jgi:isopenicillin-N epimerase
MTSRGYKGFGSFHSDNVQELLKSNKKPPLPPNVQETVLKHQTSFQYGHAAKAGYLIDSSWNYINHGAFGSATVVAFDVATAYSRYMEMQSLRWIDRQLFPMVVHSIKEMAKFVGGNAEQLVYCQNATTAINAVVARNIQKHDVVFCLDIGYGSVKTLLKETCSNVGAKLHLHTLTTTNLKCAGDVVQQVKDGMPKNCTFAVFDHVASNTAIVMPIKELIEHAQSLGAKVLIDGAHGLGAFDLHLEELNADFYVSNCHKWLSSTKGVGILYVSTKHLQATRPVIVSHGWNNGFTEEWIWDGTRDYSGEVTIPILLDWWRRLPSGLEGARSYCRNLLKEAISLLTSSWHTKTHVDASLYSQMALVEIPRKLWPFPLEAANSEQAKIIQDVLHYQFKIECPVKVLDASLYVRISVQIYNALPDYEMLAKTVNNFKWKDGDFIQ